MANTLLQAMMNAGRSGKLAIGAKMSRTLDSGTVVDVINKGKGVLQKIVKKQNGDVYTSIFKNGELQQVTARNSRGGYTFKPDVDHTFDFLGCLSEKIYKIKASVKGPTPLTVNLTKTVNGSSAANFGLGFDTGKYIYSEAGAKKIYDYLVRQNPDATINDLYKYIIA